MGWSYTILSALITGFFSGVLLSIPVGPINLSIIHEGARRGFGWAALMGLGATVMEVLYCTIAFTGFASLFRGPLINAALELTSFVFLLYLGLRFVQSRSVRTHTRVEERLEEKLHPHSAFWIGFVRCLGNPGVLLFWIVLSATFISRGWVAPDLTGKLACILGVALGVGIWFIGLSWAVSFGHRRMSEATLLKLEHYSGITLLLIAGMHGLHIAWQLAQGARH